MSFLEKLKGINRKWFYLLVIIAILVIGGGIAGKVVHERHEKNGGKYSPAVADSVYLDLLYLESSDNLKITPDQAKAILPLVEKLAAGTTTAQLDLVQKIYSTLSPQQYQALLNSGSNYPAPKKGEKPNRRGIRDELKGWKGGDNREGIEGSLHNNFNMGRKGLNSSREEALGSVIIKMLTTRAGKKATPVQPGNQQGSVGESVYKTQ